MSDEVFALDGVAGAGGDEASVKGKRRFDEERRLEPWERYRVLTDIAKLQLDMLEMADRRTRFALLILGTLEEYLEGWRQATIANVNKELASHVQHRARAVAEKYTAIGRLYWRLMLLVFMTAAMLAVVVVRLLLGSPVA